MTTKHTPGPWRLTDCGKHRPDEEAWKRCTHIATIDGPLPVTIANMRLKAAAPDLLAALEDVLPYLDDARIADGARAAIAKAKGQP